MKTEIKNSLNNLHLSDIYSLLLFIVYRVQDIPEYATLSELCFLLDGSNMTRLLTYFAGRTIKIPTAEDFTILSSALMLYQYINVDGDSLTLAMEKLGKMQTKQKDRVMELYLKMLPILKDYNIDRGQLKQDGSGY